MNNRVSYKITYLNFLLALMIVGLHGISAKVVEQCGSESVVVFRSYIRTFFDGATGAFFMLSAFLMYRNRNAKDYRSLVVKRFYSLMVPYFFYNFVAFIFTAVVGGGERSKHCVNGTILQCEERDECGFI